MRIFVGLLKIKNFESYRFDIIVEDSVCRRAACKNCRVITEICQFRSCKRIRVDAAVTVIESLDGFFLCKVQFINAGLLHAVKRTCRITVIKVRNILIKPCVIFGICSCYSKRSEIEFIKTIFRISRCRNERGGLILKNDES